MRRKQRIVSRAKIRQIILVNQDVSVVTPVG